MKTIRHLLTCLCFVAGNMCIPLHAQVNNHSSLPSVTKDSKPNSMLNWRFSNKNRGSVTITTAGDKLLAPGSQTVRLRGNVISSSEWTTGDTGAYGLYDFDATTNITLDPFTLDEYLNANGGGAYYDGKLHYISFEDSWGALLTYYHEVDLESGEVSVGEPNYNLGLLATDVDYDPVEQRVIGCFMNDDFESYALAEVDYEKKKKYIIKSLEMPYMAVAVNGRGELYAINQKGQLLKVNKENGEETLIGSTGIKPYDTYQSAAFDRITGKLYWAAVTSAGMTGLYSVDITNGTATLVSNFPKNEQVVCLTVLDPTPAKEAPQAIIDLKAAFGTTGSNDGVIGFTLPTKTLENKDITEALSWELKVNGETLLTGTGQPGDMVNKSVTLQTGNKLIQVCTSNAAGKSTDASMNIYVGYDMPNMPQNVLLIYEAEQKKVKLSWDASTKGFHNGYVDADNLTYSVIHYPSGDTVATNIKQTSTTIDAPKGLQQITSYGIVAVNGVAKSRPGISNSMKMGDGFSVPYEETFDDPSSFDNYTVINSNNDDVMWQYFEEENNVICPSSIWEDNDDWLITPYIHLDNRYAYKFSFDVKAGMYSYPPTFEVGMGMTEDYMSSPVIRMTSVNWTKNKNMSAVVKGMKTGDYLFGFHCTTEVNMYHLLVDNIKVEILADMMAPDSITGLKINNMMDSKPKSEITFQTPNKRLNGTALSEITKIEVWRDDMLVKTFETPALGETLSFIDEPETSGSYTYTIKPFNEAGVGLSRELTVMIGEDQPLPPSDIVLKRKGNDLILSWNKPGNKGKNGGYVYDDQLKYVVYDVNEMGYLVMPALDTISTTTYTINCIDQTGRMRLKQMVVTAINTAGQSDYGVSSEVVLGDPVEAPLKESFSNGNTETFWYSTGINNNVFSTTTIRSQDNDNGCMVFSADEPGDEATLKSGRISLAKVENPCFAVSYYAYPGKQMLLYLDIYGEEDDLLKSTTIDYAAMTGNNDWNFAYIDLSAFKDQKYVRLFIRAKNQDTEMSTFVDNLRVDAASILGVETIEEARQPMNIFSTDGVLMRNNNSSLQGLPKGVYIIGNKKVVVR